MNEADITDAVSQFIQNHGMPRKHATKKAKETIDARMGSNELRRTLFIQEVKSDLINHDIDQQYVDLITGSLSRMIDSFVPDYKNDFSYLGSASLSHRVMQDLAKYGPPKDMWSKVSEAIMTKYNEIYTDGTGNFS